MTAEDVERACNGMTTRRGRTAQPAAQKTVRNVQLMFQTALAHAERRGHVRTNVAAQVPLRRVPRVNREPLTPDRARAVLSAARGDRHLNLGPLAVANVRYQALGSGKRAVRAPLKTAASAAPVPLPAFVAEQLRAPRIRQQAERPIVALDGDGLVFVTERGYAISGSWLTKRFQALLARASLPRMRLHDMRHGAASLLVAAGVHPRIAQDLLRHASPKTTMEIYSHVSAGQQREAADVLQRLLGDDQSSVQSSPLVAEGIAG